MPSVIIEVEIPNDWTIGRTREFVSGLKRIYEVTYVNESGFKINQAALLNERGDFLLYLLDED